MLIITNECNLNCSYCYQEHREKNVMKKDVAKKILAKHLSDTQNNSFLNIVLFGGEPFLYFEMIKEICEWVWENNWPVEYIFNFSTNGTLLTNEIREWLNKNSKRILLTLSADGARESHNINRNNSFDKIDFRFFVETWKNPYVKMTISEQTLTRLAEDIIFFHDLGFEFSECNFAVGINWTKEENELLLKREMEKLIDYYIENHEVKPAPIINMDVLNCELKNKVKHKACGIGDNIFTYDCDGKLYPCNYITPMTFKNEDLKKLLAIDYTKITDIMDDDCFDKCYLFPVCPTCYAGDYDNAKRLKKKNYTLCKLTQVRAYYSAKLRAIKIKESWEHDKEITTEKKIQLSLEIKAISNVLEGMY